MEFFHLIKASQKSGKKDAVIWFTAKSVARANLQLDVALEEAGIEETGRGKDYAKPIRTDFPVYDDLPEEGAVDYTWCERYELQNDDRTWLPKVTAENSDEKTAQTVDSHITTESTLPETAGITLDEHDDDSTLYPVVQMPFRKQLLSQFTADELRHHVTHEEYEAIGALEMDTDNSYVQNLLLAAENCPEVKGYDTKDLWRYTDAIRKVFSQDKRHELALVLRFTRMWAATDYIDRGILAREWAAGNRISSVQRTDSGTNADGGYVTDRGPDAHHTLDTLDLEIACALLPMDFNHLEIPGSIHRRAKEIVANKEEPWKSWSKILRNQPGVLAVNRAAIFNLVRIAPENIHLTPVAHLEFVNQTMTAEFNDATELLPIYGNSEHKQEVVTQEMVDAAWQKVDEVLEEFHGELNAGEQKRPEPALSVVDLMRQRAADERLHPANIEATSTDSQPQVANLGGGMFSIDGLMSEKQPQTDDRSPVTEETTSDVQMEETDPAEGETGNTVPPGESSDAADPQTASLTPAEVLAAVAPELANDSQPEMTTEAPEEIASTPEYPAYFEPGRYEGLPNNIYHAANGISSTQLKDARVSLMFYHGRHVTKTIRRESSEALTFGSLSHTMALEPEKLHEEFAVFPGVPEGAFTTTDSMKAFIREFNADKPKAEQLKLTGKKEELQAAIRAVNPDAIFADEFEQEWRDSVAGKTILSSEQLALATAIQQALLNHESAGKLLRHPSRSVETSYFGMDDETGLEVRVRPDLEVEINGVRIGVDLKTISMGRVKQEGLRAKLHREIIDRDYHLSAGMYCSVADFDQFFWIFVNKDEGYHWVAVIEASEELLALGREEYQKTMRALAKAYDTNCWPAPITEDYTDELNDFDLRRLEALRTQA
ncbi:PD-(D/E)XK nuclease-like domain-containing protein [Escherichia coli]|nr:PD-(D/E)XK nuclease-like domain-containing protein [Escherichia coli]